MKSGPIEIGEAKSSTPKTGMNKGVAILDFILRILAFVGTLGSAILMGTTNQTLPFFTQFVQFRARFQDLPSFTFFVLGNAIVSGYLIVSLGFSIFHIIRSHAQKSRVVLVFLDAAMLVLLTSAASAAAAIVYLAHKGNAKANWLSICQQFNSFCERTSGSLIGSYVAVVTFVILIALSGFSLSPLICHYHQQVCCFRIVFARLLSTVLLNFTSVTLSVSLYLLINLFSIFL